MRKRPKSFEILKLYRLSAHVIDQIDKILSAQSLRHDKYRGQRDYMYIIELFERRDTVINYRYLSLCYTALNLHQNNSVPICFDNNKIFWDHGTKVSSRGDFTATTFELIVRSKACHSAKHTDRYPNQRVIIFLFSHLKNCPRIF